MPILDTANAVLPKNNQDAPGESVYREVVYSGFAMDDRTLSNDEIKEIFNNTKSYMFDKGILVKVKITHDQEKTGDQEMKGFLRSMELHERSKEDGGGLSIWSKMHLYPETYEKWKNGIFPEVSIGAFGKINDRQGNQLENVLDHVALYSVSRVALPELNGGFSNMMEKFSALVTKLTSLLPNNKRNQNNLGENKIMEISPDEIKALIMALEDIKSTLAGWVKPEDETEEMETDETKPEDKEENKEEMSTEKEPVKTELKADSEITEYKAQLKNDQDELKTQLATIEYDKLFTAGKIVPDQRENFIKIYKAEGKEFAYNVYGERNINTPPKTDKEFKADPKAGESLEQVRKRLASLNMEHTPMGKKILDKHSNN
jgi:hypothetical protein